MNAYFVGPTRGPDGSFHGMQTRHSTDLGSSGEPGARYMLRWETLPSNRDRPRPEPWPAPTMLRLVRLAPENTSSP